MVSNVKSCQADKERTDRVPWMWHRSAIGGLGRAIGGQGGRLQQTEDGAEVKKVTWSSHRGLMKRGKSMNGA